MPTTDTAICNLALRHIGIGKMIANVETEQSAEATACRSFLDHVKEVVLRDFPWPFARQFVALGLVEEDPTSEWAYSYRYPSACITFKRILSGTRNDTRQTRVPYIVTSDDDGLLIYTGQEDAEAEYIARITNAGLYPPDFVSMLSLLLASFITPSLAAGDPFKLRDRALKLYDYHRLKAQANAVNEQQDEEHPESEFIRERG